MDDVEQDVLEEMEDTESKKPLYDICFHLLKLYSNKYVDIVLFQTFSDASVQVKLIYTFYPRKK